MVNEPKIAARNSTGGHTQTTEGLDVLRGAASAR
jgi:hypothetical protein